MAATYGMAVHILNALIKMRLIDKMVLELRDNKENEIDESIIADLGRQICRRLDCLKISNSPTARK